MPESTFERLPEAYRDLNEPPPVAVAPPDTWLKDWSAILKLRKNLLVLWPKRAYEGKTFTAQLFKQHYFICNSPDSVRRVFLDEHDNYDQKSPQMRHSLEPLLGDGLFVSDGAVWKERRAYCAPAFESELLPDFAAIMVDSARELADHWESLPTGSSVDMLNEMARLTSRIIGRTIFGDDTSEEEAATVVDNFSQYQKAIEQLNFSDSFGLPHLKWLGNPVAKWQSLRAAQKIHTVIDQIIERHPQRAKPESPTLLSYLLGEHTSKKTSGKRCPLSSVDARNEAIVMFMAGHETTANTLAWVWYLLDRYPRVADKLQEELTQVLGDRLPRFEDVPQLPYTRAIFEETLRLYPPVPVLSRQARASDEIRGKAVLPNSIILVIPWLLHRHNLYWEKPNHFIPERFMPGQPRPDKFVYIPFSVGPRVCLGLRFGLTEGILCLATLAQRFRAKLKVGHEVEIECRLTLRPQDGLPMQLEPTASSVTPPQ